MLKVKIILFFTVFSLPLILESKVQADLFGDYVPRDSQDIEQRSTVGSGSRSNCQSDLAKNSVSLLVPKQKVVHHTSLEKPSFFLVSNEISSAKTFKFTLIDPQGGKTLVEKDFSVDKAIERIELPQSTRLQLGKVYLWYVAIPCTNDSQEYREVLGAAIKRTEPNQNVKTQLHQAKNDLQTAAIYAQNGFWYEAVEIAVKEHNRDRKDSKVNHSDYLERILNNAELN